MISNQERVCLFADFAKPTVISVIFSFSSNLSGFQVRGQFFLARVLTVLLILGTGEPKGYKMPVKAEVSMIFQK